MQKYDIHVCLVSDQAAANLLPVAVSGFTPKEAIFLITKDMLDKGKAKQLKKAFQSLGIAVYEKSLTAPFDFEITEEEILSALDNHNGIPFTELDIALNVTGGTKVMAMAAQSIFALASKSVFYVNTDKNNVIFLSKDRENNFEMKANLPLRTYFISYGFDIRNLNRTYNTSESKIFTEYFIYNYSRNSSIISILNGYTSRAKNNVYKFTEKDNNIKSLNDLLSNLMDNGFVKFTSNEINFLKEENRQFIGGSWLEHYVFKEIKDLEKINDIAMSITISNSDFDKTKKDIAKENLGKQNEFDLAFIANNKLHIIECKTVKMNDKGEEEKDDNILYKLKALTDKMGTMAKGCLVSYLPVSPSVANRAKADNIKIIDGGKGLQSIRTEIKEWIEEK